MTFQQALTTVLQTDSREQVANAFYLYCRISDVCKLSYEDARKNKLFFEMNKRLNIVESILRDGKLAVSVLKTAYPAVKNLISMPSYKNMIDCVAQTVGVVVTERTNNDRDDNKATTKAVVTRVASQPSQTISKTASQSSSISTPVSTNYSSSNSYSYFPWTKVLIGIGVVFVVAALVACLVIFRRSISWNGWQHVIGSLGGLVLTAISLGVIILFDEWVTCDFFISGLVALVVFGVANWVLNACLSDNYRVIFVWLSAYEIIGGIVLIFNTFDELENGWAWGQIGVVLTVIAGLVLGLVVF